MCEISPICFQRDACMLRLTSTKILILLLFSVSAQAQKLKYKDIYGLLSTKQYEKAEPFLKKYLLTEKENPNAFLFMGLIYQEKAATKDVLKETDELFTVVDSAIFCYDRASALLNDRELKRNKEYYEAYNRRDLRTGEFGVSLSDIQFDLQKKKEALIARASNVRMVKHYFVASDSLYQKCGQLYRILKERHPTEQALFLQAGDSTTGLLQALAVRFDSTRRFIRLYQASMGGLGKAGYKQEVDVEKISEYSTDGTTGTDFYAERIRLWDYGEFSERVSRVITDEILPLRAELVNLDAELNKLAAPDDSISITAALKKFSKNLPYERLKKFDSNPLPLNLIELKLASLQYRDAHWVSRHHADSLDVNFQVKLAEAEAASLHKLDSIAKTLREADLGVASRNYEHFVSAAYSDLNGVTRYLGELTEYAEGEAKRVTEVMRQRQEAVRWIRVHDESVPLMPTDSILPYRPLVTEEEKYTVGLKFVDSTDVSGYFYSVTPSRVPDIGVTFPVDKTHFLSGAALGAMATDANDLIYYILIYAEEQVNEKFPATLAKVYRADGLSWSVNYPLDFVPESIEYRTDSGDLILGASQGLLVFDKNGKPKQSKSVAGQ